MRMPGWFKKERRARHEGSHAESSDERFVVGTDGDLMAILNRFPALIGYWDHQLRNRIANDAYIEFFGISPDSMHGMHIRDLLGADAYEQNLPHVMAALDGEEQRFNREIADVAGKVRHVQVAYIPDIVDGEVRGFFVQVDDLTDRAEAEQSREAAEKRFRLLFDAAPVGSMIIAAGGIVTDVNDAALELLQMPREALVGRSIRHFAEESGLPVSDRHVDELYAGTRDAIRVEHRIERADGTSVLLQLDMRGLQSEQHELDQILVQALDISAMRAVDAT